MFRAPLITTLLFFQYFIKIVIGNEITIYGDDMKNKIFYGLGILVALIIGIIIGNGISESNGSKTKSKSPTPSSLVKGKADNSTSDSEEEQDAENFTDIIKTYYGTQPSIENFYVTGTIDVNRDGDVKPGIYNLVINQGGGNISNSSGSRVDYKNWIGYPAGSENSSPSKFRVILIQGEKLELKGISKASLEKVDLPSVPTSELGAGTWVVGVDIAPGTYKLSANYDINAAGDGSWYPEMSYQIYKFDNEGKNIGDGQRGNYDHENTDVAVKLEENEIIEVNPSSYGKYNGINVDDMKLKFDKMN